MDENQVSGPEALLSSRRWIGLLVAAVILAEAIWGLLAAVTSGLLVPLLAQVVGGDPQSPLYLGKGDVNVPALFSSVLAVCLAGIVFVALRQWSRKKPAPARLKTARVIKKVTPAAEPLSITAPPEPYAASAAATASPQPAPPAPVSQPSPPVPPTAVPTKTVPLPVAAPAKPVPPAKPKKPKEVYYNIVGEPINPTEDD